LDIGSFQGGIKTMEKEEIQPGTWEEEHFEKRIDKIANYELGIIVTIILLVIDFVWLIKII